MQRPLNREPGLTKFAARPRQKNFYTENKMFRFLPRSLS